VTKQKQNAEAKSEKKRRPQVEPVAVVELASLTALPGGPLAAAGDGTMQAQAARLGDPRLHSVQRQAMAAQIGRLQGNGHLLQVIERANGWKRLSSADAVAAVQRADQAQTGLAASARRATLASIQGHAMFNLLPMLQALPVDVRTDEEVGGSVGGPRMVTAMHVVRAKGTPWLDFAAAHNGELASLPVDQIGDIMRFLGAPKGARYFKSDQFDGRFDGAVDPARGVVTLFFRVRFEVHGARFGMAAAGTREWEEETRVGLEKFKARYKEAVEDTWSGKGTVQAACPIGAVKAFQTKVVVTVVESGEHKLIHIVSDEAEGRQTESTYKVSANKPGTRTDQVVDPTGRRPEQVTTTQIPSTHEFGHAVGLGHVHCPGRDDPCYGVTAEERRDVMGTGNKIQVIKRGGMIKHDDFAPFERIGERWGRDMFPGALAKCNKWSAG